MNLHPIMVHFPIGLLTVYTLLELTKRWQRKEFFYVRACFVLFGVLLGIGAFVSGVMIEEEYEGTSLEQVMETHEAFGIATLLVYGVVAVFYLCKWMYIEKTKKIVEFLEKKHIITILAILGLILITITGALGGGMAHGRTVDPVVEFIYKLFFP